MSLRRLKLHHVLLPRQEIPLARRFSTSASSSSPLPDAAPQKTPSSDQRWFISKLRSIARDLKQVPPVARTLGLAGAVPFLALSPPMAFALPLPELLTSSPAAEAQAAYGALILSFLGGPHWGLAMSGAGWSRAQLTGLTGSAAGLTGSTARYVWSVTPCLVAWFALLLPPVSRLCVLVPGFVVALGVDWVLVGRGYLPRWYLPLRILLTGVAVLSLGSSLVVLVVKNVPKALQQHSSSRDDKKKA